MKTKHLLMSIGVRTDHAPHQSIWCTNCGTYAPMPMPAPIDTVLAFMRGFEKSHCNCEPDAKVKLGFLKVRNPCEAEATYVWGGLTDIASIASTAFHAASKPNGLAEPYFARDYDTKRERAEACIMDMITFRIDSKNVDWFSINYADVLGYDKMPHDKRSKNWPGIRMRIFMKVANALISTGRKKCKKV